MKFVKFLIFTVIIIACGKSELSLINDNKVDPREGECRRSFVEKACIVGTCAGTMCEAAATVGGCKKAKSCAAIPGGCLTTYVEIMESLEAFSDEHADWMLQNDYVDPCDWQTTYDKCRNILIERALSYQ
ncbi:MAG: hypothetical protein HOP11_11555 [Saprospiraceae bacterium]|nr:hypothetical protein [Saprospiraceae bacterium]